LCTGRMPFTGKDSISTLLAVATEQPKPPCDLNLEVPAALSDLVLQLLAKNAADRPASAQAVVDALTAIQADQTMVLEPGRALPPRVAQGKRTGALPDAPRRRRGLLVATAV